MVDCLRKLGLGPNTLIFADMEDRATLNNQVKNGLNSFWSALNNAGYRNHAVYVYAGYRYRDAVVSTVGKSRTWLAQYPFTPSRGGYYERQWRNQGYGAWQFSSTSRMPWNWWFGNLDLSTDFNGLLTNAPSTSVSNGWLGNKYYVNGNGSNRPKADQRQMVSVRIGRFNEDRFSVGGKSKQNLLLRFKRADAVRSAVHQRQVVLVRQKHGRNEDRVRSGWQISRRLATTLQTGKCSTASNTSNGKWYLFDKNTGAMKTGLSAGGRSTARPAITPRMVRCNTVRKKSAITTAISIRRPVRCILAG